MLKGSSSLVSSVFFMCLPTKVTICPSLFYAFAFWRVSDPSSKSNSLYATTCAKCLQKYICLSYTAAKPSSINLALQSLPEFLHSIHLFPHESLVKIPPLREMSSSSMHWYTELVAPLPCPQHLFSASRKERQLCLLRSLSHIGSGIWGLCSKYRPWSRTAGQDWHHKCGDSSRFWHRAQGCIPLLFHLRLWSRPWCRQGNRPHPSHSSPLLPSPPRGTTHLSPSLAFAEEACELWLYS